MAKKIFVSYKYADTSVYQNDELDKIYIENKNVLAVTPRSYLNGLETVLENVAIQKWEKDNEDLSGFKEETIESKLKDKIYDSTITIVLISPKMKEEYKPEEDQWIPWKYHIH